MNQVVLVSSNANNGTNAGTFIVNANNDSSNRNRNIGTRLAVSSAFKTNSLKNNWNIYDIHKNGVDFVGYVFSPQKTKLRKTISNKFKEVCKKIIKNKNIKNPLNSLMAYKGWVKFCNAKALWRKHTTQVISMFPKQIRRAV
jgi:hypothetical protein